MKLIGYTRVSTAEQAAEGVSLAAQEAKLRAYCDLYGHDLVEVVVDAGASAKSTERPGLQRALGRLRAGEVEGLLVAKLDRLTRSVRDLGDLVEGVFKKSALVSVAEQVDTSTAGGRMMLNLMTVLSQWEREVIGERTSAALQFKKSQGAKLGPAAYEAPEALARMRELRARGLTYRAVADVLGSEGHRPQRGGSWHAMTVKRMLAREGT